MPHPTLDEIERRPQQYWDVDGLPELIMGLLWMIWGAAWLFGDTLPRDWRWNAYWMVTPAALAVSGFAAVWATKRLKARYTFPRTGYVEWKEPSLTARLAAAAVAIVTASLLVVIMRSGADTGQQAAPILGVILSLAFVVASLRQRAPHYLALAGVALALGVALWSAGGGWTTATWLFVWIGAASALVGAVRLALFIRRHPRPSLGEA
ncbi:MAG TPA: hypothetical protein VLD67_05615 [Vicinamibacterales bacterium]|nr:hypothetical protein [Vicinamibacterales bacterium]